MAGSVHLAAAFVLLLTLFTQGNAQCYTATTTCTGASTPLGSENRDCCVGPGMSYDDGTGCQICYVIGYSATTSAQTINEGEGSMLVVTVLKPPPNVGQVITIPFQIDNSANTADIRVGGASTPTGTVLSAPFSRTRSFTLRAEADQVGQEGIETFPVPLNVNGQGLAVPVFSADPAMITVIDQSQVIVEITEADYQQREGQGNNIINARVSYNRDLVNAITISFIPVTYEEYFARGFTLPDGFPSRQTGPEFEAQEADFNGAVLTVTLPPGDTTNRQVDVNVPIIDDLIVEAQQTFVGYIQIQGAVDEGTIMLERTATMLIINDDDELILGFTQDTYTFNEGQSGALVTVAKDGGVVSERTDIAITVSLQGTPTATQGEDFQVVQLDTVISVPPGVTSVDIPVSILEDLLPEGVESFTLSVASAGFGFSADRTDTFATTEVFIRDNDDIVVGLEMTEYTVREDAGFVEVCARVMSPPDDQPLPRDFMLLANTLGLTATQGVDFEEFSDFLPEFNDANRRRCFSITILEDVAFEIDEEFRVLLAIPPAVMGVTVEPSLATVQILDPDPLTIGLSQGVYTVTEGTDPLVEVCAEVTNGVVARDTIVLLQTADNTAEEPGDYLTASQMLTFMEDISEVCTSVRITDDEVLEDNENFILMLTTVEPRVTIDPAQGSVLIIDDDNIMVGFEELMYEVDEDGISVEVCAVIVNGEIADDVTVSLVTEDNSALAGSDYTALTTELTFAAPSTRTCTDVNIINDQMYEVDETFFGRLTSDNLRVQVIPARAQTTIQINDEDSLTIGFTMTSVSVNVQEGDTATLCAAVLAGIIGRDVPIQFDTRPGTAQAGSDYVTTRQQLDFSASDTEICVDVDTVENNLFEDDEQFGATLVAFGNIPRLTVQPAQATVNIMDDDNIMVTIGFVPESYTVLEGAGGVSLGVEVRGGEIPAGQTVEVTLSTADDTANAPSDYTRTLNQVLQFTSDITTLSVFVPIIDDSDIEDVERFLANLQVDTSLFPEVVLDPTPATVDIISDDIVIGFVETPLTVSETDNGVRLEIQLMEGVIAPQLGDIVVTVTSSGQTATENADYSGFSQRFTFDSDNSGFNFVVPILDDDIIEATERFIATLTTNTAQFPGVVLNPDQAVVNILDDDVVIGFDQVVYDVDEDEGTVTLTVSIQEGSIQEGETRVVTLTTMDDSALSPNDYTNVFSEPLTFSRNIPTNSVTISIADDMLVEGPERFTAELSVNRALNPGVMLNPDTATVNIIDDDVVIGFVQPSTTVPESGNAMVFVAVLDGTIPPGEEYIVTLTTSDDTATEGSDYASTTQTLTFSSTSGTLQVSIPIVEDSDVEGTEEFTANLAVDSTEFPNVIVDPESTDIIILDDDIVIGFDPTAYTVNEGGTVGLIARVLEGEVTRPIVVTLSTEDGTAISPGDYDSITNQPITFRPGTLTQTIIAETNNDDNLENVEQFLASLLVNIDLYPGVTIGTGPATVNIIDSDMVTVGFDPTEYTVREGDGAVEVCVSVDPEGVLERQVEVTFSTEDDSALDGEDYTGVGVTLTFDTGVDTLCMDIEILDDEVGEPQEIFRGVLTVEDTQVTIRDPNPVDIVVTDDDVLRIGFEETQYEVVENEGSVTVGVAVFGGQLSEEVTVRLTTEDGTATEATPSDYTELTQDLTFGPDTTRVTVDIPIVDDDIVESVENFFANLELLPTDLDITVDPPRTEILIEDFGDDVVIGLERTLYSTPENGGAVEVCAIIISGTLERAVEVDLLTDDDTAISSGVNSDYMSSTSTLTFDEDTNVQCVDIPINDDDDIENDETFTVSLETDDPDTTLNPRSGQVIIENDDDVTIGFELPTYSVDEDGGSVTVCAVVLDGGFQIPVMVRVSSMDGSATSIAPVDFTAVINEVLTFEPGSSRECVDVDITDDNIDEDDEDFTLSLTTTQDDVILSPPTTRVIILDEDQVVIGFEETLVTTPEGSGVVELCAVIREGSLERSVDVTFSTEPGTAEAGVDYTSIRGTRLVFSETSTRQCVDVSITDDDILEEDEDFTATLVDMPSEGIVIDPDEATIVIVDDTEVVFGFERTEYTGVEGTRQVVCVVLQPPGSLAKPVTLSVTSEDLTAVAPGDYVMVDTVVQFAPGMTRVCLPDPHVTLNSDSELEETEQLRLRLDTEEERVNLDPEVTVINIQDGEGGVVIGFEQELYSVDEDGVEVEVCAIVIAGTVTRLVNVVLESQPGTASGGGVDYDSVSVDLEFNDGITRACTRIPIVDDLLDENDENFDLTLTTDDPDIALAPDNAMVIIIDNDNVTIGLERTSTTVSEDDGTVEVCASVQGPVELQRSVRVVLSTLPGSALAGLDYTSVVETLMFDATNTRRCLDVPITDDDVLENDEDFLVELTTPEPDVNLMPDIGVITIEDTSEIVIGFEETIYRVNESTGTQLVCAVLMRGNIAKQVDVLFTSGDPGTATGGTDYGAGSINLPFNSTTPRVCVNIAIADDNIVENTENFTVTLNTDEPRVILQPDRGEVIISDDDAITPIFEVPEYSIPEPDGPVEVCATIPFGQLERDVVIALLMTIPQTATVNTDYSEPSPFQLTFTAGSTRACVEIDIIDDPIIEDDETFIVVIPPGPDVNPVPGGNTTTVTIIDDDVLEPEFEQPDYTVPENGGPVEVCVVQSQELERDVVITIQTGDGSAIAGGDYVPLTQMVTFSPGLTRICTNIPIVNDSIPEPPEIFVVEIPPDDGVDPGPPTMVEIIDDDVIIGFEQTMYVTGETVGEVSVFVAVLEGEVTGNVLVRFRTGDGSAVAPDDYTSVDTILTFNPTTTRIQVPITIIADILDEPAENLLADLTLVSSDADNVVLNPDVTEVVITDVPPVIIGFEQTEYMVDEEAGQVTVGVAVLDGVLNRTVDIAFTTQDGTATSGAPSDYTEVTRTLNFAPATTRIEVTIPIVDDDIVESVENFFAMLALETVGANVIVDPARTQINIVDNDTATPEFEVPEYSVPEDEGPVEVCVLIPAGQLERSVVVNLQTVAQTATANVDYRPLTFQVTFMSGSTRMCVDIEIPDDRDPEDNETFIVEIPPGPDITPPDDPTTITILDNDVVIGFERTMYNIQENGGQVCMNVLVLEGRVTGDVLVRFRTRDGSALAPGDYTFTEEVITFDPATSTNTVCVPITEDNIDEMVEVFFADLILVSSDGGDVQLRPNEAEVAIMSVGAVQIGFEDPSYVVNEEDEEVTVFVAVLDGVLTSNVTVGFGTIPGTATSAAPSDFTPVTPNLTFGPATTRLPVTIPIVNDDIVESVENFFATLTLVTVGANVLVDPAGAEITIFDRDPSTPKFELPDYSIPEDEGPVEVCITIPDGQLETDITVNLRTAEQTATANADYRPLTFQVEFTAGSTRMCVDIDIPDDRLPEEDETFTVIIMPDPRVNPGPDGDSTVTILDNDIVVGFEESVYFVNEGDGTVTVFVVVRDGVPSGTVIVGVDTADGTASFPDDYGNRSPSTVTFNSTVTRQPVTIPIVDDDSDENVENFFGRLRLVSAPDDDVILQPQETGIVINDNDGFTPQFELPEYTIPEDEGPVTVCVVVPEGQLERDVSTTFVTVDGVAIGGQDYISQSFELVFEAGTTRLCQRIPIVDDNDPEPDEPFTVEIRIPGEPTITTTVTIIDDDAECPVLSAPAFGSVRVTGRRPGDIATYTCNTGFELIGPMTRTCEETGPGEADWDEDAPICRPLCDDLPDPQFGSVSLSGMTIGSTATYQCDPGFILVGPPSRTCEQQSPGSADWDQEAPVCEPLCDDLPDPQFGSVSLSGMTIGSTATYQCDPGFILVGPPSRTCEQQSPGSADWDQEAPVCEPLCDDLPDPQFGSVSLSGMTIGSTATYQCDPGFILVGPPSRTCEQQSPGSADWDQEAPVCEPLCDDLPDPQFGSVSLSGMTIGSTATYQCDPGFILVGPPSRTCEQQSPGSADWDQEAPVCEPLCDDLPDPQFGSVSLSGMTIGSTATYQCDPGFSLVGPPSRTCEQQSPGSADWDREAPICERVTVQFVRPSYTFTENGVMGFVEVMKTGVSSSPFTVQVIGGPSNQANIERSADGINEIITFGAGSDAPNIIRVNFTLTDDDVALEDIERYIVNLVLPDPTAGVLIVEPDTTQINVLDDDVVTVMFARPMASFNESDGAYRMCVVKDRVTARRVTVTLTDAPGTAGRDEDYRSVPFRLIGINPEDDRTCFTGVIIDDSVGAEGTEFFNLIIEPPTQDGVNVGLNRTTINIIDDDIVTVIMVRPLVPVPEANGQARVCARKDIQTAGPVDAVITTAPGKATDGDDYAGGSYTVVLGPEANAQECAIIGIVVDGIFEDVENFDTSLSPGEADNVVVGPDDTTVVLIDDLGDNTVNDTLIGDPLLTVPLSPESLSAVSGVRDASLCYEIHGEDDAWFNLLSDGCVSVNAHYFEFEDNALFNFVDKIAIRAVDEQGNCQNILIELGGCTASINGTLVTPTTPYCTNGVFVRPSTQRNRVRVSVPNCDETSNLVMWTICQRNTFMDPFDMMTTYPDVGMLKFVIARGFNLGASSHGLIGQFWNIPIDVAIYNGPADDSDHGQRYMIQVAHPQSDVRIFTGLLAGYNWEGDRTNCFYVGNRQGGTIQEVDDPNDSVIEGSYADYKTTGEFDTEFKFSHFDETRCS